MREEGECDRQRPEAFAMDELRADLSILAPTDARTLERWKRGEDGATDPC